jgi:O-antigen ligase
MYFGCGSLIFINSLFDSLLKRRYGFLILGSLFLYSLIIIVLIASKTGIIAFIGCSIILLWYKVSNKKMFSLVTVFILISAAIFLFYNDVTRERFTGLNENLGILSEDALVGELRATGLNVRLLFWKISLVNQWNDGLILIGVGTGDAQDYINSLYNLPQYQLYGYLNWDSHNQWVYSLLQLGIIGIATLGLLYAKSFKEAIVSRDLNLIIFLLITFAFSLSECILEVNKGIVFFSLFFTILTVPDLKSDRPLPQALR